ncbi:class E sortase [Microbispora sp. ATCC PTA-5024]|uniref:class E sortase n=1 Tax=Microbispora sp. ATCC PTA-5024 TaxID=316330 RepID=UPI0003DDE11E|nr:class E sortase [Microbispora sp. ATCC PTA-5024]ETK33466.1 hypothetical protein MPTA5024_24365 [Microbispora sp. ATCC PTA-5024]
MLVLFCAYLLWGTGAYTERHQRVLQRRLLAAPAPGPAPTGLGPVHLGGAVALIRIPRFGGDYRFAIVEGVDAERLREGPGHYPGTALPGHVGNFVVSGHRTTYGAPFNRLAELRRGDPILIDTAAARYTYRVTSSEVVDPWDLGVVAAVPGRPGARPARALITLTTCNPEFSARQRLVIHGELDSTRRRES